MRGPLLVVALALAACPLGTPDVGGAPIACKSDSDCQLNEVCDPAYGLCIAAADAGIDGGQPDSGPTACVINSVTYDAGAFNPTSPCQTCQPGTSTSVFTPLADGFSPGCPQGDVCHGGSCTQGCYFPGSNPAFVPGNAINAGNPCQVCLPTTSTTAWQPITGLPSDAGTCPAANLCLAGRCTSGCLIDGGVVDAGTFEPGAGCESCNPASPNGWTPATGTPPPGACDAGQVCNLGACQAGCFLDNAFVADGGIDPTGCNYCNSAAGTTTSSQLPDKTQCYDGGTFCNAGACVPDCLIDGGLVPDGGLDPANGCGSCQPAVDALSYSPVGDGTGCTTGGNYCQSGLCVLGCDVQAILYTPGEAETGDLCQVCAATVPGKPVTAFSAATDGTSCSNAGGTYCVSGSCAKECQIGGALFADGTVDAGNPNVCCNVADSSTAWTPGFGSAITTPSTTATPGAVAIGDVTGDGIPDLVVAETGISNLIEIFAGHGDGTFASPSQIPAPNPTALVLADFDNDGHLDIAVANNGGNSVTVLLNQTDGGFLAAPGSPYPTAGTSPSALIVADLHELGDLVLIDQEFGTTPEISVLFNQLSGRNSFTAGPTSPAGTNPTSLVPGNFMNKGNVDLAVADGTTGEVTVFANNGTGTSLTAQAPVTVHAGDALSSIATADFNLDSEADLAVSDTTSNQVFALLNAAGTFIVQAGVAAASSPISLVTGDFNGDGLPDMAVAEGQSTGLNVIINQTSTAASSTTFVAAQPYSVGAKPVGLGTAVLISRGKPDLVTVDGAAKNLSVLLGNCP